MELTDEQVSEYLRANPNFFAGNTAILADVVIPHPQSGNAISLAERQQHILREKNQQLEARLRQLIQFGSENDAISEKMHRFTVKLLEGRDLAARLDAIVQAFAESFALPGMAIRLWGESFAGVERVECSPVSEAAMNWIQTSVTPYCGTEIHDEMRAWLPDGENLKSFAAISLGHQEPFGILLIGSPEPRRFYPEIGKMFLNRLGELVTAGLEAAG